MAQWSLDFDGSNDYVSCGDLPSATTALTVECWVRLDTGSVAQGIVCKWDSADANKQEYTLLSNNSDDVIFRIQTADGEYRVTGANVVQAGTWQHVAGVYDGDELRLYVDGVEVDTETDATGNMIATSQPLELGRSDTLEYMNGGLAYVRISNNARYTTTFTVPKIPAFIDVSTLGQWDFIEGNPFSTVNNRKGVATYDGVINGTVWSLDIPEGKWTDSYERWGDAWTIFVNGVDRTSVVALESLVVKMETGSSRDTAQFRMENVTTAVTAEAWQRVKVWHGGTLLFGGFLAEHEIIVRGFKRDIICHCVDWTALIGKRWKAPETYTAQTCAAILADVYGTACTEINATTYVEAGETLDYEVDFDYLDDITDRLAEASGYIWYVREDEEGTVYLHFRTETASNKTPFNLSTSPDMVATFPMQVLSWSVSGSEIINDLQFVINEDLEVTEYTTGGSLGNVQTIDARTLLGTSDAVSIAQYGLTLQWVGKISRSQADIYTSQWLADRAYEKTSGRIRIWQAGIMPGTYINIEHSVLDVDDTFLVSTVEAKPEGGSSVIFDLTVGSQDVGLRQTLAATAAISRRTAAVDRENMVVRVPGVVNANFNLVDAIGGGITVTLPTAAGKSQQTLIVVKIDSSVNPVYVEPQVAETINGGTSVLLIQQWQTMSFYSTGSEWIAWSGDLAIELIQIDDDTYMITDNNTYGAGLTSAHDWIVTP